MIRRGRGWLYLAGAIVTEVSGSLSLRGALDHPGLYVVVVCGFAAAFTFLAATLRQGIPLGVAYGVWGATGVALTAVLSMLLFDEPLTALMGVGIVAIIAGVLCIELGSHSAQARGADSADRARSDGRHAGQAGIAARHPFHARSDNAATAEAERSRDADTPAAAAYRSQESA